MCHSIVQGIPDKDCYYSYIGVGPVPRVTPMGPVPGVVPLGHVLRVVSGPVIVSPPGLLFMRILGKSM